MNHQAQAYVRSCSTKASDKTLNLLYLTWPFPPLRTVGCVRTWNVAKYLSRLGWGVTVVTPNPGLWRRVEKPEVINANLEQEGIQRILTGHNWRCLVPEELHCWDGALAALVSRIARRIAWTFDIDNGFGWIKAAEKATSVLNPADVDLILATGSPFATFDLAGRLAKRLCRPYVLDYRDPWSENPHRDGAAKSSTIQKEKRLLAGSAAV